MLVKLVCPACKTALIQQAEGWRCVPCERRFLPRQGVLSFLDSREVFNASPCEDAQKQDWSATAQLRERIRQSRWLSLANLLRIKFSLSGRRDRIFYDEMRHGNKQQIILDLGCGGGRHYFCDYGQVVGIDPVLELLQMSRKIYAEVYHGSALTLPFADNSFDYVVSSDVIGHIPVEAKDTLFREVYRVLKKGGRAVHVIETDSTNRWYRLAHQHPDLFQRYFVDGPGHIGLELPTRLRARFLKHGFKEVTFRRMGGNVLECGMIAGFFNNEFKARCWHLSLLAPLDGLLARNLAVKEAVNLLLEPLARIDDYFTPLDHASGALVVFEK